MAIRECRGCRRTLQIARNGLCARCCGREERGEDLVTGLPLTVAEEQRAIGEGGKHDSDKNLSAVAEGAEEVAPTDSAVAAPDGTDGGGRMTDEVAPPPPDYTRNPWQLLERDGWLVEIPEEISQALGEHGFYAAEIVELLRKLLAGRLREVK